MTDPLTFIKLGFAAFALGMMLASPSVQGPVGVFAFVRWAIGQIATEPCPDKDGNPSRCLRRGGYWLLSGVTCIVCWSVWTGALFRLLVDLPQARVIVDVFAISGLVIALERATERPKAALPAASPMPQTLTARLEGGDCPDCKKPTPAADGTPITTVSGPGFSAEVVTAEGSEVA